jgi:hypothetical protein
MLMPLAFAAGFALGWWRAGQRGGSLGDRLQYGAGHGLAGLVLGMIATLVLARAGVG